MGENRIRRILAEGRVAVGAGVHIPAGAIVEILGRAGYDFVAIDLEHGEVSVSDIPELIRAADAVGVTSVVRVPGSERDVISRVLEFGVQGVIVPRVANGRDAARAVAACSYGGPGGRGACPLIRGAGYGLREWAAHQEEAERETMVFALVEDLEGARNIGEIVAVEGVDVVFLGPFDMSVTAGLRGDVRHPEISSALDGILEVCREKGVPVMHAVRSGGRELDAWIEKGVRLIVDSTDTFIFARGSGAFLESISHLRRSYKPPLTWS